MGLFQRILQGARRISLLPMPGIDLRGGKAGRPVGSGLPLKTLAEGARTFPSLCHHCGCGCGLQVTVRDGAIVNLEGDPAHPINEGGLCAKGAAMSALHALPGRVLSPRVRRAGADRWEDLTWEAAIDRVAKRLLAARDGGWEGAQTDGAAEVPVARTSGLAFLAGARVDNEEAYLFGKLGRLLGVTLAPHPAEP